MGESDKRSGQPARCSQRDDHIPRPCRSRVYKLNDEIAKLFVRPRGWHLPEAHILIDGEPATGCLVDFGLYFFHNHAVFQGSRCGGAGPFFYLPKMEHSR